MAKIGRNDPCPCGSGKKYKRCCGGPAPPATADVLAGEPEGSVWVPDEASPFGGYVMAEDDIDRLSNSVVDLIQAGRLDEAEDACRELAERYPDQIASLHRYAAVYEAREELAKAAQYARKAADFARTHEGFDENSIASYIEDAERLEAAAQAAERPAETDGQTRP